MSVPVRGGGGASLHLWELLEITGLIMLEPIRGFEQLRDFRSHSVYVVECP